MKKPFEEFEDLVADCYRSLGYQVTQDTLLGGNQIDVLAVQERRELRTTVIVECKHHDRPSSKTGKSVVGEFYDLAHRLLRDGLCSHAVMVTNTGYTRYCPAVVEPDPRVRLLTVADLQREAERNRNGLLAKVRQYAESTVAKSYIDLDINVKSDAPPEVAVPTSASDLVRFAIELGTSPLVVTADFGSGKTTVIDHLYYSCLNDYLMDSTRPLPCRFLLRELCRFDTFEAFVSSTAARELELAMTFSDFVRDAQDERFVLLFDGFDEISSTATRRDRANYLVTLAPLLFTPGATILTSRPSYFESLDEFHRMLRNIRVAGRGKSLGSATRRNRVLGADGEAAVEHLRAGRSPSAAAAFASSEFIEVGIEPLSPESVIKYVSDLELMWSDRGLTSSQVLGFLDRTYDLSDLTTRPLLLAMLVEMMLDGLLDPTDRHKSFGPAKIYEIYTSAKLGVDADKRLGDSETLDWLARRSFATECAWLMFRTDRLELTAEEVRRIAIAAAPPRASANDRARAEAAERHLTDLRTCSFLTLAERGELRFVHKSFQEYFCAHHVYEQLLAGEDTVLAERLPRSVVYFLGSIAREDQEFLQAVLGHVRRIQGSGKAGYAGRANRMGNLLSILCYAGERLSGLDILDARLAAIHGWNVEVDGSAISQLDIDGIERGNLLVSDSRIGRLSIDSGQIRKVAIDCVLGGTLEVDTSVTSIWISESAVAIDVDVADLEGSPAVERLDMYGADVKLLGTGQHVAAVSASDSSSLSLRGCSVGMMSVDSSFGEIDRSCAVRHCRVEDSVIAIESTVDSGDIELQSTNATVLVGWSWQEGGVDRGLVETSGIQLSGKAVGTLFVVSPLCDLAFLETLALSECALLWGHVTVPGVKASDVALDRFDRTWARVSSMPSEIYLRGVGRGGHRRASARIEQGPQPSAFAELASSRDPKSVSSELEQDLHDLRKASGIDAVLDIASRHIGSGTVFNYRQRESLSSAHHLRRTASRLKARGGPLRDVGRLTK